MSFQEKGKSSVLKRLTRLLRALCPSFLLTSGSRKQDIGDAEQRRGRPDTEYLDGLRGLASLTVLVLHFVLPFDREVLQGYGDGLSDSIINLPVIRIIRAGGVMVRIFFVISGYVLTISCARHYHNRDWDSLLRSLSAASIKRGVRLFLPTISSTLVVMVLVRVHGFQYDIESLPAHFKPQRPIYQATFLLQVEDWLRFVSGRLTNPWNWVEELFGDPSASYYGAHLWSIQTEYHCSMILFFVLMALSRIRSVRVRNSLVVLIIAYCAMSARWEVCLFLVGMAMAAHDVGVIPASSHHDDLAFVPSDHTRSWRLVSLTHFLHWVALATGLWLASYPDLRGSEAFGFRTIGAICAQEEVWHDLGAVLIVWAAGRLAAVRSLLCQKSVQYAGKVSYALYIVHEPMLQAYGWEATARIRDYWAVVFLNSGYSPQAGILVGNISALMLVTFVCLCAADYLWRALDKPCVRLIRHIDNVL